MYFKFIFTNALVLSLKQFWDKLMLFFHFTYCNKLVKLSPSECDVGKQPMGYV